MKHVVIVLILFIQSSLIAQTFDYQKDFQTLLKQTNNPKHALFAKDLDLKFKSEDSSISAYETLALLIHFTHSENYRPFEWLENESKLNSMASVFQYEDIISYGDSLLKIQPYNPIVLYHLSQAHRQLQHEKEAKYYEALFNKILAAMKMSGDGSFEHPIFSLGSKDSEKFIDQYYNMDILNLGSGIDSSGNILDVLTITDHQKDTITLYFSVQHTFEEYHQK